MISGIVSVTLGLYVGSSIFNPALTSSYALIYLSVSSFSVIPSALAALMILSSTSVKLDT